MCCWESICGTPVQWHCCWNGCSVLQCNCAQGQGKVVVGSQGSAEQRSRDFGHKFQDSHFKLRRSGTLRLASKRVGIWSSPFWHSSQAFGHVTESVGWGVAFTSLDFAGAYNLRRLKRIELLIFSLWLRRCGVPHIYLRLPICFISNYD
uniref:Uncharacterized protein n=1 Tax=Eutreptiella gymnastica TaxID=73025 RepID=A0A7S4FHB2_9EUGL